MSLQNLITCPKCGHNFSLSDVQKHELEEMREKMKIELESEVKKKAHLWAKDEIKKAEQKAMEENKRQALELEMLRKRDDEARKKELEFLKQGQEFENLKRNQEIELEKARIEERKKLEIEIQKQAEQKAKFEEEKIKMEYEKKFLEQQKQMDMLRKSVENANRKANQWSQQIQWEVGEDALKELLTTNFPIDIISDVEKGIKWADIIQEVRDELGRGVGIIVWESKNTKSWSDGWVEKLKEDRLKVGASISVIVSSILPEWIKKFGIYKDIWVCDVESVLPLTIALRSHMIELIKMRNSLAWKDEKMEVLYNYLVSSEFKAKIENIIEAFSSMKNDLDREKRSMERMWSAREKQLSRVIDNTARLYGDMQGLLGSQLETVKYLELDSEEE